MRRHHFLCFISYFFSIFKEYSPLIPTIIYIFNSISKSTTTYAGFSVLVFVRKNSKMDGGKDMPPCSLDIQSSITMRLETYFVRHIPLPCRPQKRPQSCAQLFPPQCAFELRISPDKRFLSVFHFLAVWFSE